MITPIRVLNIREVCGRMDDLLVSADDIKKLAKKERAKAIEEFADKLKESMEKKYRHLIDVDRDGFEWLTTEAVETHIDETVKELKGE